MKIVCDNCGAKYSIADEKVKGKVFRIRCKKCSNSIVVRGESQAAEPVAPPTASMPPMTAPEASQVDDAATRVFDYSGYQGSGDSPIWHVSMDGEQQGPYTKAQVDGFLAAGNINHDTYVWRDGLDDWLAVRDCSEFATPAPAAAEPAPAPVASQPQEPVAAAPAVAAAAAVAAPAASAAAEGGLFDSPAAEEPPAATGGGLFDAGAAAGPAAGEASPFDSGGGLFAGGDQGAGAPEGGLFAGGDTASDDDGLFASSGVGNGAGDADIFGGGAPAEGGDMFAAGGAGAAPSPRVDAGQAMLTGQRNENSVLFSLSNLQALASSPTPDAGPAVPGPAAMGGPARQPGMAGDDASGLIDIRSLASSLQSAEKEAADDGLLNIGGGGFAPSLGAPVLAPSRTGMSKGVLFGIIGGGVAFLGVVVALVVMLATPEPEQLKQGPSATELALADKLARLEELLAKGGDVAEADAIKKQIQTLEQKKEEEAVAVAVADDPKSPSKSSKSSSRTSAKSSGSTSKPKAKSSKKASSGKASELDDLLGGGAPKAAPKKKTSQKTAAKASTSSGGDVPQSLSKSDVKKGLKAVAGKVKACGKGQTGTLKLKIVISNSGRVKSATPTGSFAGSPAGLCAARAVRAARFPRFKKSSLSVTYPFKL